VVIVADGAEAVEALKHETFDVVLMDVQMPTVDGYEATRRIRRLPGQISSIPIIGVTAYARDADKRAVLDCGMNEYVSKPFRLSTLIAVLGKVTDGSGSSALLSSQEAQAGSGDSFDETVLDHLLAAVGADTFRELVADFAQSIDTLLAKLEAGLETPDAQSIRTTAHRLIGVAGQFGGKAAAEAARAVEFAPEEQLSAVARELIDQCRHLKSKVLQWKNQEVSA